MKLIEGLQQYTKVELQEYARQFDLKRVSSLNKQRLIERIVSYLTQEDVFLSRIASVTESEFTLFSKACKHQVSIKESQHLDGFALFDRLFIDIDEETAELTVYEEFVALSVLCQTSDFKEKQAKHSWLRTCLSYAKQQYGIAPIEVVHQLYTYQVNATIDEMVATFQAIPMDLINVILFPMQGFTKLKQPHPLADCKWAFLDLENLSPEDLQDLLVEQDEIPFYIPKKDEMQELAQYGYQASDPYYQDLDNYLRNQIGCREEQAAILCTIIWNVAGEQGFFQYFIDQIEMMGLELTDANAFELFNRMMHANNHTRMIIHRGHTPLELEVVSHTDEKPENNRYMS
ncbi:MAG: Rho termination factor N-terminal domain-containing protein [Erysipelotrichaceae bacterium]